MYYVAWSYPDPGVTMFHFVRMIMLICPDDHAD